MSSDSPSHRVRSAPGRLHSVRRYWVEYRGHALELRAGTTVIGRSANCQIVLDDGLVSRRHAQFSVNGELVTLEDFGSVNGVFVNGQRIANSMAVKDGDRIGVGRQELVLRSMVVPVENHRAAAETLHGLDSDSLVTTQPTFDGRGSIPLAPGAATPDGEATKRGDVFELLGAVADKVLALGRGAEAEKVLAGAMRTLLVDARRGKAKHESAVKAACYAVKLAGATNKAEWVDYVFELFGVLNRMLPGEAVDDLYNVVRQVPSVNRRAMHAYVEAQRAREATLSPRERFVLQRLDGLEKLAALK